MCARHRMIGDYLLRILFVADIEVENCDLKELPKDTLALIEADSFWCFSKLLDGIQDNYTFAQPGIQMKVNALKELIKRINGTCSPLVSSSTGNDLKNSSF